MTAKLTTPLSDEELEELDQFLLSEAVSDEAMLLDTLDGYLTSGSNPIIKPVGSD